MTRITDIVDNRAAEGFVAEHGLSLLIEHGDERILFDMGAGAALRPNAEKLGVDLDGVTRMVLSHSHNDHTGGLGGLALCRTSRFVRLSADFTCAMRRTMRLNGRANSSGNSSSTNSSSFTARAKRRARSLRKCFPVRSCGVRQVRSYPACHDHP